MVDQLIKGAVNKAPSWAAEGGSVDVATFQGRLIRSGAQTLTLTPYNGEIVAIGQVAPEAFNIGAGISLDPIANLIAADGTDTGSPPAKPAVGAPVRYYVYLGGSTASFAPNELRMSATAPTLDVNNIYYLTGANGLKWRFCGRVLLYNDGGGGGGNREYRNTVKDRGIKNHYNKILTPFNICPEYVDDNTKTTYTVNNATWAEIVAAGTTYQSRVTFPSDGADEVTAFCGGARDGITGLKLAPSLTGTSPIKSSTFDGLVASWGVHSSFVPAEGLTTLYFIAVTGGAETVIADDVRNGSATDPQVTYMEGFVSA